MIEERIKTLMKAKNITASKLADEIGIQRSSMSHVLNGRNKPSLDFIQKILDAYPDINAEWLVRGNGPMSGARDLFTDPGINSEIDNSMNAGKVIKRPLYEDASPEIKETLADSPEATVASESRKSTVKKAVSGDKGIADYQDDIEMVMVLYRNGTVRHYRALVACGSSG